MITRYRTLQVMIRQLSLRERVFVIFLGWAVIYVLWFFIASYPLHGKIRALNNQVATLNTQIKGVEQQVSAIEAWAQSDKTQEKNQLQQKLQTQDKGLKKSIETSVVSANGKNNLAMVLKDIISVNTSSALVANIKNLGSESLFSTSGIDLDHIPSLVKNITKDGIQVQFKSDYFNTLTYLTKLEGLQWRFYWDSLEYKVADYPQAEVVMKFYILVNQAS